MKVKVVVNGMKLTPASNGFILFNQETDGSTLSRVIFLEYGIMRLNAVECNGIRLDTNGRNIWSWKAQKQI